MGKEPSACDVGVIGLGVMGRNLALNVADHGYRVAVYNRTESVTREFRAAHPHERVVGFEELARLVRNVRRPRIIVLLVPSGPAVDEVCGRLIEVGIEKDDIIVDCGNSLWTDTIRREREHRGSFIFFGSGISGGELGARFGPSLMPGGDAEAWLRLRPIWEAIAAKVDPRTGREQTSHVAGRTPVEHDSASGRAGVSLDPCTAYLGPNGAGHYVKMVHNGIEYADMQMICEVYHLMRESLGLTPAEMGAVFEEWNAGELESYLIEITADILRQVDATTGKPLVDVILDAAGQKGTGTWTAVNALDLGVPSPTIAEAVFARAMSALKDEHTAAAKTLRKTARGDGGALDYSVIREALYCAKVCAYAQGFQLMSAASRVYEWDLDLRAIARIWRGGCIIRAVLLQEIAEAYTGDPKPANLLLDPHFRDRIETLEDSWRRVVAHAAMVGVPVPALGSALAYYDSYRSERLPASLLQAQRDYFGAHGYERFDQPRGTFFHLDWPHPERPQIRV